MSGLLRFPRLRYAALCDCDPASASTTRRLRLALGICLGGIGIASASCDVVLGIREYAAADLPDGSRSDGGEPCGLGLASNACSECVQTHCCDQATACSSQSDCRAYEECLIPCATDYACRSRCMITDFTSGAAVPALDHCVAEACSDPCGLLCQMPASYSEPDAAASCETCLQSSPCASVAQCGTNIDCERMVHCGIECTSFDCAFACAGDDAGAADFFSYVSSEAACATACGVGDYWDCPPHAATTLASSPTNILTLHLIAYPSGQPVTNASVKVCQPADSDCANQLLPTATSDAQGNVTLVIQAVDNLLSFAGYFEITSATTYPALYFLEAPLTAPQSTLPVLLITPALVANLYTAAGVTPDASLGIMEVQASDCHFAPAPNVVVAASSAAGAARVTYFSNGPLNSSATATDSTGYGVLLNAPVGIPVTFSLTPLSRGRVVRTVNMFARPGTWSFMATSG